MTEFREGSKQHGPTVFNPKHSAILNEEAAEEEEMVRRKIERNNQGSQIDALQEQPQGLLTEQLEHISNNYQRLVSLNGNLMILVNKLRGEYVDREVINNEKHSEPDNMVEKLRMLNYFTEIELEKLEVIFTGLSQTI